MMRNGPGRERLLAAVDRLAGVAVLVVADLVLDEFEYGEIGRVSREAPVLILNHRRTDSLPGGGANAVSNIASLGGQVTVVGRVGCDEAGDRLVALLTERGVDVAGVWRDPDYGTPIKRRVLAGSAHSVKQQIVRVDRGGGAPVAADSPLLIEALRRGAGRAAGALISDYSLGLLHPGTIGPICDQLRSAGRPLFVDSRSQLRLFHGLAAATPNLQEAESFLGEPVADDHERLLRAGDALRDALQARVLVVTRGSEGMSVFAHGEPPVHLPVYGTDQVADVTGAGDTVISVMTLAMLAGSRPIEAAHLANYAGGLVVMKRGTATVDRDELRRAIASDAQPPAGPRQP